MALISRLFGKSNTEVPAGRPVVLNGGGSCDVVGESFHQSELDRICGGKTEDGHYEWFTAHLVLEPENSYDSNAVKVMIGEAQVGHLSRADAIAYRADLLRIESDGRVGVCRAQIRGGWDRGNDDCGHYGVVLDLASPGRIIP
jgi:hypothetical protein